MDEVDVDIRAESITRFTIEVLTCWTVILSVSVAGRGALPDQTTHTPLPQPASTTVPCCHFHVWQSMAPTIYAHPSCDRFSTAS
jgi:hypothetical protein